ncbi:pentapeptide repeat-containing protein [Streptomyces virginiae]|uniref:pentapeptide repeat-containing protein n=1 Tax=Streptomyces virginiae TaxID=1961 RepID=UPI0037149891
MRRLLTAATPYERTGRFGPATAFVALSGALLTREGEDIVTPGLAGRPVRTSRTVGTAADPVRLRDSGLGLRTLALVTESTDSGGPGDGQVITLHTVLDGWNLIRTHGRNLDLRHADLRGADLARADLRGADLRHADLRGADLECADLCGAVLDSADLRGALLKRTNLIDASLREADLRRADLSHSDIRGATLERAALRGAEVWSAFIGHASLDGAHLDGVDMSRADERGRTATHADAPQPREVPADVPGGTD